MIWDGSAMETTVVSKLTGKSIIGSGHGSDAGAAFYARNPQNGQRLEPVFFAAHYEDVDEAVRVAEQAFDEYSNCSGETKGKLLHQIAKNIQEIENEVVERAALETGLPIARLKSETARTVGQLQLFAQLVEEGSWIMARIDTADPNRKPMPRPDIRSMLRPLGPVAVFGASNFPLAFSVAGGDTASALAAGNPVIVKAHPAHPGTSELVGRALQAAIRECNLPEGLFSLFFDAGTEIGTALVEHPGIKAGGFTGSRKGGMALMKIASSRPEPIPFYAEMSSTNPVFILPEALEQRAEEIAAGLHNSFTLGAGQFCTKPGLVFLADSAKERQFASKLNELTMQAPPFCLLTECISSVYRKGVAARKNLGTVKLGAKGTAAASGVSAAVFETEADSFLREESLAEELFGPATVLVRHSGKEDALRLARSLEGQLTATVHGTEKDLEEFQDLLSVLEQKAGRVIINGFPTGVEVSHAMVHGGPFPATSDGQSTSVGSRAIYRFCRPVCYQGFPDQALPEELRNRNAKGIWRMVNGSFSREDVPGSV
jgi:2,5-dioxopentanoate dehydrogenase